MVGSALVGNLAVNLSLETAAFQKGASLAEKRAAALRGKLGGLGGTLKGLAGGFAGAFTGVAAITGAVALVGKSVRGAQDQAAAMAQVSAALTSMGDGAGRTAGQLLAASDKLEMKSLFDGDEILKKVTANLLTFGNVAGTQFDRAQQAAVNLSARLGQDLQASTIQVGKALNDPIKGLTSLARVGIQFTDGQKEMIKAMVATGDTAGAQRIILGELERQFGGAAAAAANTDPWHQATVAIKQLGDKVGEKLLPSLTSIGNMIPGAIDKTTTYFSEVGSRFDTLNQNLDDFIVKVKAIDAQSGTAPPTTQSDTLRDAWNRFYTDWNTGSAALQAALVTGDAAIARYFDRFRKNMTDTQIAQDEYTARVSANFRSLKSLPGEVADAFSSAWSRVSVDTLTMVTRVSDYLTNKLAGAWASIKSKAREAGNDFFTLYDRVVGHSYIPDMIQGIASSISELQKVLVDPTATATEKTAALFSSLGQAVGSVFGQKAGGIISAIGGFASALAPLFGKGMSLPNVSGGSGPLTSLPKLAAGGSGVFGGRAGNDNNVLSLNGSPMAKVSKGEHFSVSPNGGGMRVQVIKGDLFDVIVDHRASNVAAPMAGQAAVMGAQGGVQAISRRGARMLPR